MTLNRSGWGTMGCFNFDWPRDQTPQYSFSGSGASHSDFVAVEVTVSSQTILEGVTARFTATPRNFQSAVMRVRWRFTIAGQQDVRISSCDDRLSCDYAPPANGVMIAGIEPHANGWAIEGASDTVSVVTCPTPDSLLNDPAFRQVLMTALDSSGKYDRTADKFLTVDSARRELAGFVARNKSTGALTYRNALIARNDPCSVDYSLAYPLTDSLVAIWHTHPFKPGGTWSVGEKLPANCGRPAGTVYDPAPSPDDWRSAIKVRAKSYMIDAK